MRSTFNKFWGLKPIYIRTDKGVLRGQDLCSYSKNIQTVSWCHEDEEKKAVSRENEWDFNDYRISHFSS